MRLTRHCAFVVAALLIAVPLCADDEPPEEEPGKPPRHAIETFVVDLAPYEQPCVDLPVFDFRPPAEVVEEGGFEDLPNLADKHRQDLEKERELGKAVDEAHSKMVIHTVNHLRHMITQQDVETTVWAYGRVAWWTLWWYHALDQQFAFAEERREWVKTEYYDRLIPIFPTLDDAKQLETLDALDERIVCLQRERRGAFAAIQRHRKEYANHLRALGTEQRGLSAGLDVTEDEVSGEIEVEPTERAREEAARVAAAAIGEANAMRAYLWLVPETSLHVSVYSRLLRQREEFLYNTRLHDLEIEAVRADVDLMPHDPLLPNPSRILVREEIFKLRTQRAVLHLYLEDMQLEAGFKRSTSIRQSTSEAFTRAHENGRRVYQGIVQNPDILDSEEATEFEAGTLVLGAFAVGFRLAGDTLNILAVQPLVDGFKDMIKTPFLSLTGIEVQNSIEKAYDGYWKARDRLDKRLTVLRKLEPNDGSTFVEWARTRTEPTETATGLAGASTETGVSILEDSSFVEATGGGLVHIFAAVAENPTDLTALYTTGAYFEQRGNAKAGAARVAVSRAIYEVGTAGGELGPEVVERIIDPMGQSLVNAVNADSWFFANWMYLGWQTAKVIAFDLVWNLPTRVRLLVAYHRTGAAYEQDDYLRAIEKRQGEINELRRILAANGFHYDRLERESPLGFSLHMALCETSHEYAAAYRRIRAAHWEREKQWIWARHEDEHSRAQGGPAKLSTTGAWEAARAKTHEDMEIARLAFKEGVLRSRHLAYTMAYDVAAAQLRLLQPVAETYYTAHSRPADAANVAEQFAEQIKAMEAEAVRGELVAVYDGLYKTMLVETAVSMVSTRLLNSVIGRLERAGRVRLLPEAAGGWSTVGARLRQTLNPWAGKFGWEGVRNLAKNAAIQGFRESVAEAATKHWVNQEFGGLSEEAVDQALDFLFSVADESVDQMADVMTRVVDTDWQADSELYRERHDAVKPLDEALAEINDHIKRASSDEERTRLTEESMRLRARRALITGGADDPEVLDAALRHLAAIQGEQTRDRLQDDARSRVLGDDGALDLQSIDHDVHATLVAGMRDRIHSPAVMAGDIRRLVDPGDYLRLNDRIFRENGFDIQSLRHALTRAARNDPARSVELLAYAIAIDQRRAQVNEGVFDGLAEDPRFAGKMTVLRETNRVAVIGDDPAQRGSLDTPGIFVDQEFDIVIRDGADVSENEVRRAVDAAFEEQGYPPPTSEAARHSSGVRIHIQSEAAIRARGRKSGRRALLADEYLKARADEGEQSDEHPVRDGESSDKPRLPDPGKRPSELSAEELRRHALFDNEEDLEAWKRTMETERGFKAEHAWHMHLMAQIYNAIIVVRNGNPDSLQYVGKEGYIPKDQTCKAKSAKAGPHKGLVVDPTNDFQSKQWNIEIDRARARNDHDEVERLEYARKKAVEAWEKYGREMQTKYGYTVTDQGLVVKPGPDGRLCKGIHGDYDLHEVFVQGPGGRWVRVSFGDGSADDNALRSGFREQFNRDLGSAHDMYLHGGQGDWDHPGKTADPPVTIFAPNAVAKDTGVHSGYHARSAEELRDVFENKLNTGWAYSDGHNDLEPPVQGIYRDRYFTSVGGQRWLANRSIPGVETPTDGPNAGARVPVRGWIPIPMWQAYGLAVDALPKIGFLADPAYEAYAVSALANTTERCQRLDGALRSVGGFFDLVDAWLISQPAGNREYNQERQRRILDAAPDWQRQLADGVPRAGVGASADLAGVARRLQADPSRFQTSHRRQTRLDIEAVNAAGAHSLFAGEDFAILTRLVSVIELGERYDPFAPIGGRTTQGVEEAIGLIDWMRAKTAAMYADIGVAFWMEYERMTLDGAEVEDGYARDEAYRITGLIDSARVSYPDLVVAFLQPPVRTADGRPVPLEPSSVRDSILTDLRGVIDARRAAAAARRAADQAVQGEEAVAAFTSAAASEDDPRIYARIETWLALSGRS